MELLRSQLLARLIMAVPVLHRWINRLLINRIVGRARSRPHPFSTMSPYTSWASLTDRTWSGRHLVGPATGGQDLPAPETLAPLFERPDGHQRMCPKSTCLFPTFAQYLTDGFLRTWPEKLPGQEPNAQNRKRNTSNHEIDMCTLYGRTADQTRALRVTAPGPDERGCLKSQRRDDGEYPPFLFREGEIDPDFRDRIDMPLGLEGILEACAGDDAGKAAHARAVRDALFAVGGDRVNSVPQVSMMNTLWLREHNRLARELGRRYPAWDDDRLFETARNIVIVQFIKIVVEDYINHIAPIALPLMADPKAVWNASWNKPNWITTEFSLLYRWHALIPDTIDWGTGGHAVDKAYFMNNTPLLDVGLQRGFEAMSAQPAAALGPRNTNRHLLQIEIDSIRQGRICELASYNDYRDYLGGARAGRFEDISSDPEVVRLLRETYGAVDRVDFFVGIFCEDRVKASPLPQTILSFVALDAFSQAMPNPLLSEHVFRPPADFGRDDRVEHPAFTRYGWEQIAACGSLRDVVARNIPDPGSLGVVAMTQAGWRGE